MPNVLENRVSGQECWVVRRLGGPRNWEARHRSAGSSGFDDERVPYDTFELALAAVPAEFVTAVGPRDPETHADFFRVALYREGAWEQELRAAGLDPEEWFRKNDTWRRPR